jgi:hypothetical protein
MTQAFEDDVAAKGVPAQGVVTEGLAADDVTETETVPDSMVAEFS